MNSHPDLLGELLERSLRALRLECLAVSRGASVIAPDGVLVRATAHGFRYRFDLEAEPIALTEGPIRIETGGRSSKGTLDRATSTSALVTATEDLGTHPGQTTISADTAFLVERLTELLTDYAYGSRGFNRGIVRELLSPRSPPARDLGGFVRG